MTLEIRQFEDADAADIRELWEALLPDERDWDAPGRIVERKRHTQPELFLVATVDGALVGAAVAGHDGHRGWLHHVGVDPRRRWQGVGRALVPEAERRLAALGCPKVKLQIVDGNAGAIAFYRALGSVDAVVSMGRELPGGGGPA